MNRSSAISALACLLLAGAGGIVWWKMKTKPDRPPVAGMSGNGGGRTRSPSRPVAEGNTPAPKWRGLADDRMDREARLSLARGIDRGLPAADVDFLFQCLRRTPDAHAKEAWWVVMNEIMAQMCAKGVAPERLGKELISLVEDPSQPEVVRDYAVQYLSNWVAPLSPASPGERSAGVRVRALEAIVRTVTDPALARTTVPGTAIMALVDASRRLPAEVTAPVWTGLDPTLESMLTAGAAVPLSTRTTVIQAFALRHSADRLPLIRALSRDEAADPSLRLSAIAALGVYRSCEDYDYLASLAQGTTRYRFAAQEALRRIPSD